jgi:magnesium-transporting ATPase (P-type)
VTLEDPAAAVGLDGAAVRARVEAGLVNAAPPTAGRTVGQILRANVLTRFNAILGAMFVVVMVVGPVQDALFGIVLVVNTGFGVVQELRAKRMLDRLAILTAAGARVIRDGAAAEIPVDQVVLDDVLDLRQGDQVPVDGVVLRADGLEADEALLTGEAEPEAKRPGEQVLSGSFVVAGTGRVRASGVGGDAYAARLQAQARRFSLIRSELQQGTNQILRLVTWVMIPAEAPNATIRALAARYNAPPRWTVQAWTPFSSARKWSGVSFAGHGTWLLGAPAVVAGPASPAHLPAGVADTIAAQEAAGRRALLLASTSGPLHGDRLPVRAEPAALVVLAEELREDAAATVRYLLGQGVTIKVLSGDAPRAVAAIAGRAGIPVHGPPVDASALSEHDDAVDEPGGT